MLQDEEQRVVPARGWMRPTALSVGWAGVLAPFLIGLVAILRANWTWLIHKVPDDSLYYFEIARRLGRGEGSTFDGINETNGFHPLWQALLVPVGWVFKTDEALVRAALVLGLLLCLASLLLVMRVAWRAFGPGPTLLGGVVAANSWAFGVVNGMEGSAVVLALALVLTSIVWFADSPEPRRAVVCGLAVAVCVLARFDLAAVMWVVPVAMALRVRSVRLALWCVGGAAIIGVPFGLAWLLHFGHLLTTSATVKEDLLGQTIDDRYGGRGSAEHIGFVRETFASYFESLLRSAKRTPFRDGGSLRDLLGWVITALAVVGSVVAVPRWLRQPRAQRRLSAPAWGLAVVATLVALKGVVDVVAAPLWAMAWYSAPQRLVVTFSFGALAWIGLRWLFERSQVVGVVAGVLVVVACLPTTSSLVKSADEQRSNLYWQDQMDLAGDWVLENGPEARYGGNDAGLLGFRLDDRFTYVNLDGLVNDYDYAEFLRDDPTMLEKAQREGVEVLVGRFRDEVMAGPLSCGEVLWTSPGRVPYTDSFSGYTEAPVYVVDVRGCP